LAKLGEIARAFIAVEVSERIKEELCLLMQELPQGLRLVKKGNMHLTLKFLGEITGEKAVEIARLMDEVKLEEFSLSCKGIGVFPNERNPRVLFAKIESEGLLSLQKDLETKLENIGFEHEEFVPHLTIARATERFDASALLAKNSGRFFGECKVSAFFLMGSTLTPSGPIHKIVHKSVVKN
jgi:RNA 2',3'-cyclic 3'-phosphodiesterase